uniref:Major capsid protein N-terminal domain-containing protein n=1 Tax=viral metagenome TaxID=1070528 RepID=A0A6C0DPD7_9ZZZZ
MAGGLLNIISVGNNNVILTGEPSKTFFKVTYSKYTNFGLQKFRLDYDGSRDLRLTEPSTFTFKVKRYADLLMDTYLVVNIPDIWSPLSTPCSSNNFRWTPYEFRWIPNLGSLIIKEITITCGSLLLQRYTGEYLNAMVERDFSAEKKDLFNKMTGNIHEFTDPGNAYGRINTYPTAFYSTSVAGAEPSIRGRQLFIPINTWFTLDSRCAFPLVSLQYNELNISVTLRPIQELFQVRDVYDIQNLYPYVQPDFNQPQFQMYRFLQTPPAVDTTSPSSYTNQISVWNSDVHLLATYCFLSKDEAQVFAAKDQIYLVKDVFQYNFHNVTGTQRLKLTSSGMIANWMWYLQRNDVNLRNEWTNYTNWPYGNIPGDLELAAAANDTNSIAYQGKFYSPSVDPFDGVTTGLYITGDYNVVNVKPILETMGILLNGEYRENILTSGVYEYVEKYVRTQGAAKDGLYCYNFCLNTSPFEYQPSGAINMNKFKNIELEITTYVPPVDTAKSSFDVILDSSGVPIGIRKSNWQMYDYNYNMTLFEERYNILSFIGGNCGMMYSR